MNNKQLVSIVLALITIGSSSVSANGIEQTTTRVLTEKIQQLEQLTSKLVARIDQLEQQGVSPTIPRVSPNNASKSKPTIELGNKNPASTEDKVTPTKSVTSTAVEAYQQMIKLIEQKEYNRAEKIGLSFSQSFKNDKQIGSVFFWLGEIKMLFGDLANAKLYYQKALEQPEKNERTPEVLLKMSVICYQTGELDEGDRYFERLKSKYAQSTAYHMAKAQRSKYRLLAQ